MHTISDLYSAKRYPAHNDCTRWVAYITVIRARMLRSLGAV
jgi:hypothetical protein